MEVKKLPQSIIELLEKVNSPKLLIRHLRLVYSVAFELIYRLKKEFPSIVLNEKLILFGAATHDIGKVEIKEELFKAGKQHEEVGMKILLNQGYSKQEARFAKTHGNWDNENLEIEDLIVGLSDKVWKGKRVYELEELLCQKLSSALNMDYWDIYLKLDLILENTTINADQRIAWQSNS